METTPTAASTPAVPVVPEPATDVESKAPAAASTSFFASSTEKESNASGASFSDTPGKFGSYVSYLIMVVGMIASIICMRYSSFPVIGSLDFWVSDCPAGYEDSCRANQAVLRFSFALAILFGIQLIGTAVYPKFYDILWVVKFSAFVVLVIGFFYAKPEVFDSHGYAWFARIGGFFFVILQQVILLDFAFAWNEKWVKIDDDPYSDDVKPWRVGLILSSVLLFAGSISALGVMFWQFSGPQCEQNNAILALTLVLTLLATLFQLTLNQEYSLLTSAVMTAYATYIAYSAVTLNPDQNCNPSLSTGYQSVSSAIGMGFTILSLTWATHTAVSKVTDAHQQAVKTADANGYDAPGLRGVLMELCVVFLLGATYYGMVLTNWNTIQSDFSLSNPRTGTSSMWLQASAQWIALLMYVWALVAPSLFPNRDFS